MVDNGKAGNIVHVDKLGMSFCLLYSNIFSQLILQFRKVSLILFVQKNGFEFYIIWLLNSKNSISIYPTDTFYIFKSFESLF